MRGAHKAAGASSRAGLSQQRRGPRLMSPQRVTVTAPHPTNAKAAFVGDPEAGRDGLIGLGNEHRRCHRLGDDFVGWSPGRHARDRPTFYRKTARTLLTPPRSPLPLWPNRRRSCSPPPQTSTSRNITPDILWMSRAEYHILLFYQVDAPLKHFSYVGGCALPCREAATWDLPAGQSLIETLGPQPSAFNAHSRCSDVDLCGW